MGGGGGVRGSAGHSHPAQISLVTYNDSIIISQIIYCYFEIMVMVSAHTDSVAFCEMSPFHPKGAMPKTDINYTYIVNWNNRAIYMYQGRSGRDASPG